LFTVARKGDKENAKGAKVCSLRLGSSFLLLFFSYAALRENLI
jgi:hypothetical protein